MGFHLPSRSSLLCNLRLDIRLTASPILPPALPVIHLSFNSAVAVIRFSGFLWVSRLSIFFSCLGTSTFALLAVLRPSSLVKWLAERRSVFLLESPTCTAASVFIDTLIELVLIGLAEWISSSTFDKLCRLPKFKDTSSTGAAFGLMKVNFWFWLASLLRAILGDDKLSCCATFLVLITLSLWCYYWCLLLFLTRFL